MDQLLEFVGNHPILFIALGIILALLIGTEARKFFQGSHVIDPVQAMRLINQEDAVLIDVRRDEEFRDGHIINAINLPLDQVESPPKKFDKLKAKPVIAYCQNGYRSSQAVSKLHGQGFEQVYLLRGGMDAWRQADLPVTKD